MDLSDAQNIVVKAIKLWHSKTSARQQVFRVFGFAGTGKTTIAQYIAREIKGKVLFAAFTGKAALMLKQKGCHGASTIHSLIYKLDDENYGEPKFVLNYESPLAEASLLIVDEVSMVDEELANDLLSFGKPILVLGDPFQLPPISGTGFFTDCEPDHMLTEIHRQAKENPIIQMSMIVREGGTLEHGVYGSSRVVGHKQFETQEILDADQIIVGMNQTRTSHNQRYRDLLGHEGILPVPNEKLICLKNCRPKKLLNGSLWRVLEISEARAKGKKGKPGKLQPDFCQMMLEPWDESDGDQRADVKVHHAFFKGKERDLEWAVRKSSREFDYGYSITCHKSQGSQWNNTFVFDESRVFRENADRWLYTAITRAAEKTTIVR